MSHVLIVFQADTEQTEQLALAVGVGAVEAEAGIRLRRLRTPGAVEVGHKGYGTLREADLLWADTVVVGLEDERAGIEELDGLRVILKELDPIQMKGKRAWTFGAEGIASGKTEAAKTEAQRVVEESLLAVGITPLPSVASDASDATERMKDVGRQLGREQI
jgi:flavodoxin